MSMESLESILRRIVERTSWANIEGYSGNLPADHTAEISDCPLCGGAGWLTRRVPITDPDFGHAFPCPCQESTVDPARRVAALERYSKLGFLRHATFGAANRHGPTDDSNVRRYFEAAFNAALQYAESPVGWITFSGPSGSGKTYLAASIANRQIEAGKPALFITTADLLDYFRTGFDDDAETGFLDLFEQVRSAPLLVLDDLPTRATSLWAQDRLMHLLAWRHSARLPTVITLRGAPSQLDEYLRTRIDSVDGFSKVCSLGRIGPGFGLGIGKIPPTMLRRMTFDAFNPESHGQLTPDESSSLTTAKTFLMNWAQLPTNWLFLIGSEGAGKTHLAVSAAAVRQDAGDEVFFSSVADLLDRLRAAFSPESPISHDDLLEHIKTIDLLVLDDMGAERNTAFAEEKLFQIIDFRYNERLPTIITTSHLDVIERNRSKILARLHDRLIVTSLLLLAPDYRSGGMGR